MTISIPNDGPDAERWVRGVEAIKAFAHPLRIKILKHMEVPTTVKKVAAALNQTPSKLHYHVNLLHKHELIRVVRQNSVNGIVEHVYQVSARQFNLVNPLIASDQYPDDTASVIFTDMLQETTRGLQKALATRTSSGSSPRHPFVSQKLFRLSDTQITIFHQRLDTLIQEVTVLQTENADKSEPLFELMIAFYRHTEEPVSDTSWNKVPDVLHPTSKFEFSLIPQEMAV